MTPDGKKLNQQICNTLSLHKNIIILCGHYKGIDERARELHWEAHRRQDLIRFGRFTGGAYNWAWKGNGSNGISIPSYRKLYPIPSASLASNPNLSQNDGY